MPKRFAENSLFIVEDGFYKFFIVVNGIEESFDVEFAVFACGIRAYLDETARKLFGIEGIPAQSVAVVEIEFGVDRLRQAGRAAGGTDILPPAGIRHRHPAQPQQAAEHDRQRCEGQKRRGAQRCAAHGVFRAGGLVPHPGGGGGAAAVHGYVPVPAAPPVRRGAEPVQPPVRPQDPHPAGQRGQAGAFRPAAGVQRGAVPQRSGAHRLPGPVLRGAGGVCPRRPL